LDKAWRRQKEGFCIDLPVLLQVSGLFNMISDALILLVPIQACWRLKVGLGKRIAICAVFTIGAM
jgi:hypothetical protein